MIRQLLGDPQSTIGMVMQKLTAKYSDQVSALLTAYRLLDLEILHSSPEHPIPLPPSHANCITPQMVEGQKVKDRWRKLENWQGLLIEFKEFYHHSLFSLKKEGAVSFDKSPMRGTLAHLQGLADSYSNQQFGCVVQNFRGAALHWTFLHETAQLDAQKLPTIPENVLAIVTQEAFHRSNGNFDPRAYNKVNNYLQQYSQGDLVLPLHLSLMITPCFLLMPITLAKCKFPRQLTYQVSV